MKRFSFFILLLGILVFIPSTSFALFDVGVYGGYSFLGKVKKDSTKDDVENYDLQGWEYGFIAHYNGKILPVFLSYGIGTFVQYAPLQANGVEYYPSHVNNPTEDDKEETDVSYQKKQVGVDAYLQLNLLMLHPYVRIAWTVWEGVEGQNVDGAQIVDKKQEYFKTYLTGVGLAVGVLPLIQVYVEYLYVTGESANNEVTNNSVHLGARIYF